MLPTKHRVAFSFYISLQRHHNENDGVSNHQPHNCLLNRLFRRRSNKTSKLRVTGICVENSPVTDEFPAQRARNAENVSISWRHFYATTRTQWQRNLLQTARCLRQCQNALVTQVPCFDLHVHHAIAIPICSFGKYRKPTPWFELYIFSLRNQWCQCYCYVCRPWLV